jgi:dimethylhistidine N-methyltransferase
MSTESPEYGDSHSRVRFLIKSDDDPLATDGPNVIRNLSSSPKKISPVYVFDKRGSELFEEQCRTKEYYLRRAETRLLRSYAGVILRHTGFTPIVELGAGTAEKTRALFIEYAKQGRRCDYYPIDVDVDTLSEAMHALTAAYPQLYAHCLGTTYQSGLHALSSGTAPQLFLFLGSSIGNMELHEIDDLLQAIFESSRHGDYLLVGADLDKDPSVIDRAYNDSAGYGPRSTLNMLSHLNDRYRGSFDIANFRYHSKYDSHIRRNEVRIESLVQQSVTLASLDFTVDLAEQEMIDAEIMWKFEPSELTGILDRAGFSTAQQWIDPQYNYGLFLTSRK